MKSDLYSTDVQGGIEVALNEVERISLFCGLQPEESMTLRLLAEEMAGMISGVLSKSKGVLWVENQDKAFELHIRAEAQIGYQEQDALVAVSSSKKNEATKGILGKISGMFESYVMAGSDQLGGIQNLPYGTMHDLNGYNLSWSLNSYEANIPAATKKEEWDGLEKSILIRMADDILISVKSRQAEIIVKKRF